MSEHVFDCCCDYDPSFVQNLIKYMDLKNDPESTNLETDICGRIYQKHVIIEEVNVIVRIVRKNWSYIQSITLYEKTVSPCDLFQIRGIINKCMKLIVECLRNCRNDNLKQRYLLSSSASMQTLSCLILPISELEKEIYPRLTSANNNRNKCPVYQYFHTLQELQFYLLLFYYISGNNEELKNHINVIIKDFVYLSHQGFKQNGKSTFVCDCNKYVWLITQILCERVFGKDMFWTFFNDIVKGADCEFIFWILNDVGSLQAFDSHGKFIGGSSERINPNFVLLETSLKTILGNTKSPQSILSTLKSMEPLVCNLWLKSSKIEIYQLLWDYFSKRMNVSGRNNINFTSSELVDLIDTILWTPKDCKEDFELFLSMLSLHLNEHPYHWTKMKGRIYSQLGPNKIKDFSNVGIFHTLLLFLSLTKVNFDEVSKKFISFIENLPMEKKQTSLIWTFYITFIVRHLRENRDVRTSAIPFIKMLEEASTDQKLYPLIKSFVQDFDEIIKCSANLQLHQWLLINTWIHQYMTSCYYPDLIALLNVLLTTVERISTQYVWCDWESTLTNYVFPTLKYVTGPRYGQSSPEVIGTLAAKITLQSPNLLPEAFTFFNSESVAPKVSASFLCVVLENPPASFPSVNQETIALQTWVKYCLLTRDGYEELTRHIIKFQILPEFVKTAIANAKDPLCAIIDCIGNNLKQQMPSNNISKLCEILFGQAERWISQYFTKPENEAVVLRIYTCIGLAFFKIGTVLYNKHKASCPYARLVNTLLLPTELIIGKPVHPYILQSVKRTWHLFFEATVKLNSPNDVFIHRILQEMVIRYVQHFAVADSPMLKCLDNEVTAEIILEKLSNSFFNHPVKEGESNVFKALKLINDFVQSTTSVTLLKSVVNKTLSGIFEVIMFHSQRHMALSTVKTITSSSLYPNIRPAIEESVIQITEKHLAFNTQNYFQLLNLLVKLIPSNLKTVIPRIKQKLANVERMRGVGYDKNLRLHMERLEASLLQS